MDAPKVFISYSHDSQEHKKWVLDFATRLRYSGIDATIDLWDLKPGDDLPYFMEKNLNNSDYILMICTNRYVEKANAGTGGVGYEKMIITSEFLSNIDSNKIIPIIRQNGTYNVPVFLKSKLFIDFSTTDDFEVNFDNLIRTFLGAPLYQKPEIGNNPFKDVSSHQAERTGDKIKDLMSLLIGDFEMGGDYSIYKHIVERANISRVYLDLIIDEALELELITKDSDGDLIITKQGKKYAIEHNLVS